MRGFTWICDIQVFMVWKIIGRASSMNHSEVICSGLCHLWVFTVGKIQYWESHVTTNRRSFISVNGTTLRYKMAVVVFVKRWDNMGKRLCLIYTSFFSLSKVDFKQLCYIPAWVIWLDIKGRRMKHKGFISALNLTNLQMCADGECLALCMWVSIGYRCLAASTHTDISSHSSLHAIFATSVKAMCSDRQ